MISENCKSETSIYQLKITLLSIKPAIFRVIQIKGNTSLATLHYYIQGVMSWDDMHLHLFRINGKSYQNYEHMDGYNEFDDLDEAKYCINELVQKGDKV